MEHKQVQLAKLINEYSKSQVDLWRQIPYLAVKYDGITGWCGTLDTAYRMGLWRLDSCIRHGGYSITVDLETGSLTEFDKPIDFECYGTARLICQIDMDELDAQKQINWLQNIEEFRDYTNIEAYKKNQLKWSHIDKIYTRTGTIPAPVYGWD